MNDRVVGIISIRDNVDGGLVEAAAGGVSKKISLEPVRKVEDYLAPCGLESKRITKNILIVDIASKVEALPVRAVRRNVSFQDSIVLRDATRADACAGYVLLLGEVARRIDSKQPFELLHA